MMTRILLLAAAITAAFLFIDHRHKYLLPEFAYCKLGLGYYSEWVCPNGYGPPPFPAWS